MKNMLTKLPIPVIQLLLLVVIAYAATPSITIYSPANTTFNTPNIILNVTTNIPSNTSYSLDGTENVSLWNDTTTGTAILNLSEGQHKVVVYSWNNTNSNDSNSSWVYFEVDITPPTIILVPPTPVNNSNISNNYVYVNTTLDEACDVVMLEWNETTNYTMTNTSETNFWYNLTGLSNGSYTYLVYATDTAGNMNASETRVLRVEAPVVSAIVSFDRRLSGVRVGQHKAAPLTPVNMTVTVSASADITNATLVDYYPNAWSVSDAGGGSISAHNETYNKTEWLIGNISSGSPVSRSYILTSPQRTLPPTKYYFYSELAYDSASAKSDDWMVIVADPTIQVDVRTNSSSYDIWPNETANWIALAEDPDTQQIGETVEVMVMVRYSNGTPISGASVSLSVTPNGLANSPPSPVTTDANGVATTSFDVNYADVNQTYTLTATYTAESVSDSYQFSVDRLKCNSCHDYGSSIGHNRYCGSCGHYNLHSTTVPNEAKNKNQHNWGDTSFGASKTVDECTDCHATTRKGVHEGTIEGNTYAADAAGCGVGPGYANSEYTCHGGIKTGQDTGTEADATLYPKGDCTNCHINTSFGSIQTENVTHSFIWQEAVDHTNPSTNANITPCAICHGGAHNITLPNSTSPITIETQCSVCHVDQVSDSSMGPNCKNCHSTNGKLNAHAPGAGAGTCTGCHFSWSVMSSNPSKFINETLYNESVHGNSSVITCEDCHTNTSDGTNSHSGSNYLPPEEGWKWCEDCHVVNETAYGVTRHNITSDPTTNWYNSSYNALNVTECTWCHDTTIYTSAITTYNRTSGKDCRYCHTFPDSLPGGD